MGPPFSWDLLVYCLTNLNVLNISKCGCCFWHHQLECTGNSLFRELRNCIPTKIYEYTVLEFSLSLRQEIGEKVYWIFIMVKEVYILDSLDLSLDCAVRFLRNEHFSLSLSLAFLLQFLSPSLGGISTEIITLILRTRENDYLSIKKRI